MCPYEEFGVEWNENDEITFLRKLNVISCKEKENLQRLHNNQINTIKSFQASEKNHVEREHHQLQHIGQLQQENVVLVEKLQKERLKNQQELDKERRQIIVQKENEIIKLEIVECKRLDKERHYIMETIVIEKNQKIAKLESMLQSVRESNVWLKKERQDKILELQLEKKNRDKTIVDLERMATARKGALNDVIRHRNVLVDHVSRLQNELDMQCTTTAKVAVLESEKTERGAKITKLEQEVKQLHEKIIVLLNANGRPDG